MRKHYSKTIENALNLLKGDYVWSSDFEEIKPVLIEILEQGNETSLLLAQILERE